MSRAAVAKAPCARKTSIGANLIRADPPPRSCRLTRASRRRSAPLREGARLRMSITPAVSRRSRKSLPRQISVTGVTVIAGLGRTAVVAARLRRTRRIRPVACLAHGDRTSFAPSRSLTPESYAPGADRRIASPTPSERQRRRRTTFTYAFPSAGPSHLPPRPRAGEGICMSA